MRTLRASVVATVDAIDRNLRWDMPPLLGVLGDLCGGCALNRRRGHDRKDRTVGRATEAENKGVDSVAWEQLPA
jgi:hypothetical protein